MTASHSEESELLDSWSINASAWTEVVRAGAIPSRRQGTDDAILEHIGSLGAGSVLDVGCGEGWLARALAAEGFTVTGIDGIADLVEAARALGGANFECITYDDLGKEPGVVAGPFDSIVCNFSLLAEQLQPLLRALRQRLAPAGRLVIQTVHPLTARGDQPYVNGWRREDFSGFGGAFRASMPWYYRTFSSWIEELRAARLELVSCNEPISSENGLPLSLLLSARSTTKPAPPNEHEAG